MPGSFFESAPAGAEIYLLKNILHNWSDEDCIRILKNISCVLPDNGKILILEMVIEEDNKPSFGKLIDIQMMVFMQKYGVEDRIKIMPGSFFESAPAGAEIYLLKNILHNWSDEDCTRILNNISNVLPDNGKILILEMVIEEDNKPSFGKLIDIQMMVFMQKGKERTRKEYEELLKNAGLRLNKIIPTISPLSLIEAVKI